MSKEETIKKMDINLLVGERVQYNESFEGLISDVNKSGVYFFVKVDSHNFSTKTFMIPKSFEDGSLSLLDTDLQTAIVASSHQKNLVFEDPFVASQARKFRPLFEMYLYDPLFYEDTVGLSDDVIQYMNNYYEQGDMLFPEDIDDSCFPEEFNSYLIDYIGRNRRLDRALDNQIEFSSIKGCAYLYEFCLNSQDYADLAISRSLYLYKEMDKDTVYRYSKELLVLLGLICDIPVFRFYTHVYLVSVPPLHKDDIPAIGQSIRKITNWCSREQSYCRLDVVDASTLLKRKSDINVLPSQNNIPSVHEYIETLEFNESFPIDKSSLFILMDVLYSSRAKYVACKKVLVQNGISESDIYGLMIAKEKYPDGYVSDLSEEDEKTLFYDEGFLEDILGDDDYEDNHGFEEEYQDYKNEYEEEQHERWLEGLEMWRLNQNGYYDD